MRLPLLGRVALFRLSRRLVRSDNCNRNGNNRQTLQGSIGSGEELSNRRRSEDACGYYRDRRRCFSGDAHPPPLPPTPPSLVEEYQRQVVEGRLIFDPLQLKAARKLTRLQLALYEYDHETLLDQLEQIAEYESRDSNKQDNCDESKDEQNASSSRNQSKPPPSITIQIPRGFYIHGDVGTGKSLILNNFYNLAPPQKKRRLHFHSFLHDIHQRIHDLNQSLLKTHGRSFHVDTSSRRNPILRVAEQLSREVTLLCIDEFQVTDVADAMILSQFFGELWRRGVVVVATSNRAPGELYEGGLNREYFLPFISMLERYCIVHRIEQTKDYRRVRSGVGDVAPGSEEKWGEYFFVTLLPEDGNGDNEPARARLDQLFRSLQRRHGPVHQTTASCAPLLLRVHFQRTILVSRYHSNVVASFGFDELCAADLGSSDYHAIANHFRIVMIADIPRLTLERPDRARRFITLIDELYEADCCLACSAAEMPDDLFVGNAAPGAEGSSDKDNPEEDPNNNILGIDVAQRQGRDVSELASVKELSFAFNRAASRLLEMCSKTWWEEKGMGGAVPMNETDQGPQRPCVDPVG